MAALNWGETMSTLGLQAAWFEALLLAASGAHKVATWKAAVLIVRNFVGLSAPLATPALGLIVAAELGAAALLIMPAHRAAGALLAAVIFGLYLALIVRAIMAGRRNVDCGCSFGPTTRPLGAFHITRNTILAALAAMIAGMSWDGAAGVNATEVLAAFALLALYGAVDQVMGLGPMRRGEIL